MIQCSANDPRVIGIQTKVGVVFCKPTQDILKDERVNEKENRTEYACRNSDMHVGKHHKICLLYRTGVLLGACAYTSTGKK